MFEWLGQFVSRAWWAILLIWIGGLLLLRAFTPDLAEVTQGGEFNFLPRSSPTRVGEVHLKAAFPETTQGSSVVVVVTRLGDQELDDADLEFINQDLAGGIQSLMVPHTDEEPDGTPEPESAHPYGLSPEIVRVRSPQTREIGKLLLSDDRRSALIVAEISLEYMAHQIQAPVKAIESVLAHLRDEKLIPDHLQISLSGSAVAGRDVFVAQSRSAHSIERWTLILIVGLLLIVYRAPLPVLVPLATLVISLKVAMQILAWCALQGWISLFEGIEVYTVVVAYGAGVDFSMFLTSRFHEEIQRRENVSEALIETMKGVGPAVAAAAGTVIFGIGMMIFASFGKFHQAGISISFSLLVILCAALTFTPSLLRMMGRYTFWPELPQHGVEFRTQHVGPVTRLIRRLTLQEHSHRFWEWLATRLMRRPVRIWLLAILLMLPWGVVGTWFLDHVTYGIIASLKKTAPSVQGTRDMAEHFSPGITGPVTLLVEAKEIDFSLSEGTRLIQKLSDNLKEKASELQLSDIRSAAFPLGLTHDFDEAPAGNRSTLSRIVRRNAQRNSVREHFLGVKSETGVHATRLEILLNADPFARSTIAVLDRLQQALPALMPDELKSSEVFVLGPTASFRDLQQVAGVDRIRIMVLVTVAVFSVLVILIRSVPDSLYLMGTVIFSFLCTYGVAYLLFWWLDPEDFPGLDWTVPTFLFTILVAVGQDYNIFLVTRIHEERAYHGPLGSVGHAVIQTAAIITSCGLIMAGTFSAMVVGGELTRMTQLGFALAFGVLLDTMVVRPILVPTYFAWRARRASARNAAPGTPV